jgi:hypothetical protein
VILNFTNIAPTSLSYKLILIPSHETFSITPLLDDSRSSLDRILIFGRLKSLDILERSKIWFCDGTFKTAPPLFAQVYVILVKDIGGVHPLIYALLPNK